MNQDQRKFLISQVESECKRQIEQLENSIPQKPSLNNYLIASFLDNTIQFADIDILKRNLRESVLNYGTADKLIHEEEDRYGYGRSKVEHSDEVRLDAKLLFVIPQAYQDAFEKYKKEKSDIQDKINQLCATQKTIVMKIQIGSSSTMDKLVMQIDNMGDLNLVNTQLMLGQT